VCVCVCVLPQLAQHGYLPCLNTHGLFKHKMQPIAFSLVVDDFGGKYVDKEHPKHLFQTLQANYTLTADWEGTAFRGVKLTWDYINQTVDISMPGCVAKALQRFQHPDPPKPEHAPHKHVEPQYRAAIQYTKPTDTSPLLSTIEIQLL
jgi:hypothetical protein